MGAGADEIRQQMILDAQKVLDELDRVDAAFGKFGTQLEDMGKKFTSFNTSADTTISKLQQITTEATNAFNALAKAGQAPAAPAGGGHQHGGGGDAADAAKIMAETRTPQEQYAARMTQLNDLVQKGAIDQETFGRAVSKAGNDMASATNPLKNLTISWETMARVVVTQFIVRALSQLRDAFSESYTAALQFSKAIGEIHAIDPGRSFAETANNVRKLSDAFNQPISAVAEAQYQTISNQFTTTAQQANILTAANELSKVTTQSLSSAVLLLTGALNAYGESSEMAGLRAAQFDMTIQLGRLRMEDLATALGRTQTLAHALGVSMEELDAALISMTIGGLKASEAATQLRSLMTGLLKPSEAMQAAYKQIGVDSGEAAIATFGFRGALQAVAETTDQSVAALSKLFPNIRALPGDLRLLRDGAKQYEDAMKALAAVDMETLHKKVQDFISTDAEKLTAELNKISNFFKVEFGAGIVSSMGKLLNVFGGADGLVPVLRSLTQTMPALVASLGVAAAGLVAFQVAASLARSQATLLRVELLALVGIPLAITLGTTIGTMIAQNASADARAVKATMDATIKMNEAKAVATTHTAEVEQHNILKILRQAMAESNKEYLADADNFASAAKIKEKVTEQSYDRIMQTRKKLTSELQSIADNADKKMDENNRKIVDLLTEREDRHFQSSMRGASDESQLAMVMERAASLRDQAARLQATALDPNQEKAADAAWKRVDALEKQGESLAKQIGTSSALAAIDREMDETDARRRYSLSAQYMLQRQLSQEAAERAQIAEEHNLELEAKRQEIDAKFKDALRSKTGDEMRKKLDEAGVMTEQFIAMLNEFGTDFSKAFLNDPRAFIEMRRAGERALSDMNIQNIRAAPEAIMAMREQLQAGLNKLDPLVVPVVARMEKALGTEAGSVGLGALTKEFETQADAAIARSGIKKVTDANLAAAEDAMQAAWLKADEALRSAGMFMGVTAKSTAGRGIQEVIYELDRLSRAAKVTDEDVTHLDAMIAKIDIGATSLSNKQGVALHAAIQSMIDALTARIVAMREAEKAIAPEGAPKAEELQSINEQIKGIGKKKAEEQDAAEAVLQEAAAAGRVSGLIEEQIGPTLQATQAARGLAAAWQGVAVSASAASQAAGSVGQPGSQTIQNPYYQPTMDVTGYEDYFQAAGGLIHRLAMGGTARYFNQGNFVPRGTDVVPAMLSPNEFVMNSRATRQFYSQLVAMNAGMTPNYRAQGGGGGNHVTVGDVIVNGAAEPAQTAREVIKAIKREVRRGTSAF